MNFPNSTIRHSYHRATDLTLHLMDITQHQKRIHKIQQLYGSECWIWYLNGLCQDVLSNHDLIGPNDKLIGPNIQGPMIRVDPTTRSHYSWGVSCELVTKANKQIKTNKQTNKQTDKQTVNLSCRGWGRSGVMWNIITPNSYNNVPVLQTVFLENARVDKNQVRIHDLTESLNKN